MSEGSTGTLPRPKKRTAEFMSRTDVAAYLGLSGVNSLSRIRLPQPDARIGNHKGWLRSTIDEWNQGRPGPGWHGARDDPRRKGRAQ